MADKNTPAAVLNIARSDLGRMDGDYFVDYYNQLTGIGLPHGVPWCACFVTTEKDRAGVPADSIPHYKGCDTGVKLFRALRRYRPRESGYVPLPGDVIFFEWNPQNTGTAWDDGSDHTGLVESVSGGQVHTIEGNSGNMVRRRSYSLTSPYILGYGVPLYNIQKEEIDLNEKEVRAVSRQVMKEEINRAVAQELDKLDPMRYNLADVPKYWRPAIKELVDIGAIAGDGVYQVVKRDSQLAVIVVAKSMLELEDKVYRTVDDVPAWGRPYVQALIDSGRLAGVEVLPDGTRILNIKQSQVRMIVMLRQQDAQEQAAMDEGVEVTKDA